mmetsp:Transcript_4753/g.6877  ORF Transcript_4753/g.6877 Transcript_4753/m.6877 type:complete len:315 (+) Transcript_4753:154-1098(+)
MVTLPSGSNRETKNDVDELINQVESLGIKENEGAKIDKKIMKGAAWIKESKNIMILSGAGISCSAGIPDFRTPGTGLYDNLQKYDLPYPEAVFDVNFYRRKPEPFLSLAKELWPGLNHSPTITHSFVSSLDHHGKLLRSYTQNIDGLEHLAKVSDDLLVECHGHFRTASCIRCNAKMDGEKCKNIILNSDNVPTCTKCKGYVKPDIVFFGEGLPDRFHKLLRKDVAKADLLIVMGTSLTVAPVSLIPSYVSCRKMLINREEVESFGSDNLALLGDCDDICLQLASQLGWKEEVKKLNDETKVIKDKATKKNSSE